MELIFSFSLQIGDYKDVNYVLDLYKASMIKARDYGHSIKLYGCDFTLEYLKGYYDSKVNISNIDFLITDDLKMYIHSVEPAGSTTFDGDIILNTELKINKSADIVFERRERMRHRIQGKKHYMPPLLKIFSKYKAAKHVQDFNYNELRYYNVGVLCFRTEEIKNSFLNAYYNIRKFYLEKIEPTEKLIPKNIIVSSMLSQYYFACIVNTNNIECDFTLRNRENSYMHYMGEFKLNRKIIDPILSIIDKRPLI
tara:strand:+ start:390 stop:1148 length:759 start_codon:yes stop_codon:yes gene_type:complete